MDATSIQPGDGPVATVIVCTRNPGIRIRHTVRSILASTEARLELCLVDQSDTDQVTEVLGEAMHDPRLRYLPCAARGLSAGRNLGAAEASAAILAFTDDDCVVTPTWLAEIIAPFADDDRLAVVFGTVRPAPYDPALGFLPNYSRDAPFLARSIFDKHHVEGIGASMAVRRRAWSALHGFDPALGAGGPLYSAEEVDLVMRALLAGYHAYETPGAAVIHSGFRSWPQAPVVLRRYLHGIGATLAKHARLGYWQVGAVAARLALRWTFGKPVVDMGTESHRRARLFGFLSGVRAGLAMPLDRATGLFAPPASTAHTAGQADASSAPDVRLDAVIEDRSPGVLRTAPDASTDERVAIVVPSWNARPFLERALRALVAHTTYPYQLVIVDNGSTDGSLAYIRQFVHDHPHVDAVVIENPENRFFSTACNQGFNAASPRVKYLALYCNDVEALSDTWLQDLVAAVQPEGTIAAGQARIKPITDRYRGVFASYDPVYPDASTAPRMRSLLQRGGAMHLEGHCFLVKRALVARTGLYLHTGPFTQYHSDWEWYLRFAAMGYDIVNVDLRVHHWHSISELLAEHPAEYEDLVAQLDDPARLARYLEHGRPMYQGESGYRARHPGWGTRLAARARRRFGWG
ncbi:MAG: glycosyltransferase family 2 protein [Vicinamibacterales bacterium]